MSAVSTNLGLSWLLVLASIHMGSEQPHLFSFSFVPPRCGSSGTNKNESVSGAALGLCHSEPQSDAVPRSKFDGQMGRWRTP